jgi:hypothetical protein
MNVPDTDVPAAIVAEETKTAPRPEPVEISVVRDERFAKAYNPCYTQKEMAREALLRDLVKLSQKGQRARCGRCDNLTIEFVGLKTGIGTYVVARCENCQAWYLM